MFCKTRLFVLNIILPLFLLACASMPTDFEEPSLTITNIALRNSNGLTPQFDIVLHITNPNREPLNIVGMSYEISLEDNKVVSGVSNDFPVINPYSEVDVNVNAMVSLFGGINLVRDLLGRNRDNIDYEFTARLDIGRGHPRLNINRTGSISFR